MYGNPVVSGALALLVQPAVPQLYPKNLPTLDLAMLGTMP